MAPPARLQLPAVWYHGDRERNRDFSAHTYDRERGLRDPNAAGPGIYFTSSRDEASGYGHLYEGRTKPGFRLVPYLPAAQFQRICRDLFDKASDDNREVFLSNWGEDASFESVFAKYSNSKLVDYLLDMHSDLFQHNADAYIAAVSTHFDGFVLRSDKGMHHATIAPKTGDSMHLVVFNPAALDIIEVA